MIKTFKHKGLQRFFETGATKGIQVEHATRLRDRLERLNRAATPLDMSHPGWKLHSLHPDKENKKVVHWSVWVSGNWRMTFAFEDGDAILVDYQDYH